MLSSVGKAVLYTIGEVVLVLISKFEPIFFNILVTTPLIVLQFSEPFQSGFFPNDTSISYPKRPNTISLVWAGFFGLAAPLLAVIYWNPNLSNLDIRAGNLLRIQRAFPKIPRH